MDAKTHLKLARAQERGANQMTAAEKKANPEKFERLKQSAMQHRFVAKLRKKSAKEKSQAQNQ